MEEIIIKPEISIPAGLVTNVRNSKSFLFINEEDHRIQNRVARCDYKSDDAYIAAIYLTVVYNKNLIKSGFNIKTICEPINSNLIAIPVDLFCFIK